MIPNSRSKLSDLYTPFQSKLLENHTLHSGTYLNSPYEAVPHLGLRHVLINKSAKTFLKKHYIQEVVSIALGIVKPFISL